MCPSKKKKKEPSDFLFLLHFKCKPAIYILLILNYRFKNNEKRKRNFNKNLYKKIIYDGN